jgi:hypothetical protein
MKNYWLGVVGKLSIVSNLEEHLWWCFSKRAATGDEVFLYCPRTLNRDFHGIFAQCEIVTTPYSNTHENHKCSSFGRHFGLGKGLGFAQLKILRQFEKPLTRMVMNRDPILRELGCVKAKFQGTTFTVSREGAERILLLSNSPSASRVPDIITRTRARE